MVGISPEKLSALNCILLKTLSTVSLLAQLAMQLARESVFTPLAQDLLTAERGYLA